MRPTFDLQMIVISVKRTFLHFEMPFTGSSARSRSEPPLCNRCIDDLKEDTTLRTALQTQVSQKTRDCASRGTALQKRHRGRPCKSEREKFRDFVEKVKQEALQDPHFELDKIQIPKSLNRGSETIQKVLRILQTQAPCNVSAKGYAKSPSPLETTQPKRCKGRPLKREREKFRKFADLVKQKAFEDQNFQVDQVEIPKSINRGNGTMRKIVRLMHQSRERASKST